MKRAAFGVAPLPWATAPQPASLSALPLMPRSRPSPWTPVPGGGTSNGTLLCAWPNTPQPVLLLQVPRTPTPPAAASDAPATPAQLDVV